MLDDRPYMRPEEPRFRGPSMQQPWTGWAILLTINVVVFLLQVVIDPRSLSEDMGLYRKSLVGQWLALDSEQISWLLPMQLFTYQFLHGGVWHLLMNGLGLFFIGRALESSIGRREIIGLYLVSGVVGALFQLGFAAVFPVQFAGPMVGASAGVFGFMGVLARLFPYREVYLLLFFVLPIRLKLHWVFWGSFAIALVSILAAIRTEAGDSVAHAAHLGGLLYGAFYVAKLVRNGGLMRFFFNELFMRDRRNEAGEILVNAKPPVRDDVVYVHVAVEGRKEGKLVREEFVRSYFPKKIKAKIWKAISWTTASSVCAVIDLVSQGSLPSQGFLKQEDISLELLLNTPTGQFFK